VTTQAPNSNIIPVAKVLPQPAGTPQGSVASLKGKLAAQNLYNKILFLCQRGLNWLFSGEVHGSAAGQYLHPSSRQGAGNYFEIDVLIILHNFEKICLDNSCAASINESQAPVSSQPNTPSKLIGTSPRPSILRKRDVEG